MMAAPGALRANQSIVLASVQPSRPEPARIVSIRSCERIFAAAAKVLAERISRRGQRLSIALVAIALSFGSRSAISSRDMDLVLARTSRLLVVMRALALRMTLIPSLIVLRYGWFSLINTLRERAAQLGIR
jgi:hypothetical protein